MTEVGVTTWPELRLPPGNVLLIVNSGVEDRTPLAALCDRLEHVVTRDRLHAIASRSTCEWLSTRGWLRERVLHAHGDSGPLEMNYFLESPPALQWILARKFASAIGSEAHSLYNEQVQSLFEQRVALFLGVGLLLAHTLPHPYVYRFDLDHLLARMDRPRKVAEYISACRRLIDEFYDRWQQSGTRHVDDHQPAAADLAILEHHLGSKLTAYDDASPIPMLPSAAGLRVAASEFVSYAESVFHPALGHRDHAFAALEQRVTELIEAVGLRDRMLASQQAEHAETVAIRDRRIGELQHQYEFMTRGWRRFVVRPK
ncbi:MAG: hypothetical protein JWL71_4120 [Acidobacteria bacterium]|nr:hypothetical protein [Acidobacteriota bacterium]